MDLRKTSLVLYILLIFHLQHNFPSVNSKPSSIDTYYKSLHLRATKPDVVGFERKNQELVVVIKKEGGGGWHRLLGLPGGGGGGGGLPGGRGGSTGKGGIGPLIPIPMQTGDRGTGGSHRSSSSRNIRGGVCVVCWLSLLVLVSLLLV
ncbi:hypothetical protein BRARA_F00222 [Brassica rapa]|uniref:CS domain-containing protein n=1 Tax=Brassica campestris TaxID=3711 RepID=A0A397YW08_BRACM|nr:hypothetical protein BRARA_F00222 [Brassica rapa]